jgi:hypothetical protein
MLTAYENALVVQLDALEGERFPTWGMTTTTHVPDFSMHNLRYCEARVWKYLRGRYGSGIEYLGLVEWTTGARTPGRRPHIHHLVKGLGRSDSERAAELERELSVRWRDYTGGAWRVECRPLRTPMGAIAYLTLHHYKRTQGPPAGWTGKRFRPSRGYFDVPVPQLRAEARFLLRDRRIEAALVEALRVPDGFDGGHLDDLLAERLPAARRAAEASAPKLVRVRRLTRTSVIEPLGDMC